VTYRAVWRVFPGGTGEAIGMCNDCAEWMLAAIGGSDGCVSGAVQQVHRYHNRTGSAIGANTIDMRQRGYVNTAWASVYIDVFVSDVNRPTATLRAASCEKCEPIVNLSNSVRLQGFIAGVFGDCPILCIMDCTMLLCSGGELDSTGRYDASAACPGSKEAW
jgi:hypothetical protein